MEEMDKLMYVSSHTQAEKSSNEHSFMQDLANDPNELLLYEHDNILFKLTNKSEMLQVASTADGQEGFDQSINESMSIEYNRKNTNSSLQHGTDASFIGMSQFPTEKWKMYGRQFLTMDILFDALFMLSKHEQEYKLRIPLSSLIDYKGYRCIAVGLVPIIPKQGVSLGIQNKAYTLQSPNIRNQLSYVGEVLNVSNNSIAKNGNKYDPEMIPLGYMTKVYHFQ